MSQALSGCLLNACLLCVQIAEGPQTSTDLLPSGDTSLWVNFIRNLSSPGRTLLLTRAALEQRSSELQGGPREGSIKLNKVTVKFSTCPLRVHLAVEQPPPPNVISTGCLPESLFLTMHFWITSLRLCLHFPHRLSGPCFKCTHASDSQNSCPQFPSLPGLTLSKFPLTCHFVRQTFSNYTV